VKKIYNHSFLGKSLILSLFIPRYVVLPGIKDVFLFRNPTKRYRDYKQYRGMSRFYDFFDWWGGLPFEVASVENVFKFFKEKNFTLKNLETVNGGSGCNQFVFER
jgi:2-polyprenyl-6-hydroxyphenyl methylase/3-demethylubiquinone-9 3-methyltransferase